MYNNAKKIANTGIGVVGSNGVHIIGNKILDLNTAWGNLISVDCGDSVGISNIVIQGNNLQLTQGNGIITYGLQEGSIMGNYIQGATTNYGVGIRIQYCDAVAIGAGKVVVMGNDIRTGTTNERGILVQRSAGTGGIVNIFIDNNYLKSYIGIEADWDGTVFTVTLGKNNIFNSTITVYQTSTGVPKWMELHGTNTTAADGQVQSFNNLVGTPTFVSVTSGNTTVTIICNANTFTATGFTYKLKTLADAAATGQTVYWYVRYDP